MRSWLGTFAATALLMQALPAGLARALEPQALGTISVEATPVDPALGASISTFLDEVGKALTEKGYTTIEGAGHARFVADLSLIRTRSAPLLPRCRLRARNLSPAARLPR
ncbi:hypothetical protein [Sphingobium sp. CR28]|uniref:hypothetical protein n=1 Tax=Sphingobium sp. CR28 TaxID=3400272 RepID=UPI003FF12727